MSRGIKVILGRANPELGQEICGFLEIDPEEVILKNFNDGEIRFQICHNIRGCDVFIVQPTNPPAENFLELLIIIDAAKRASASRITAVIPYFGGARQERKDRPRVPISAKLYANLIVTAGANRILTMDLHAPAIQGFFDIPTDHLTADSLFLSYLRKKIDPPLEGKVVAVSPDIGGVKDIEEFAGGLGASDIAIIYKRKEGPGEEGKAIKLIGDVDQATAIIRDDIVDTAGTLVNGSKLLKERGAKRIIACGTHPLLSFKVKDGKSIKAEEILEESLIEKLLVTNSILVPEEKRKSKIVSLSAAEYLAGAMRRIHNEESVSALFKDFSR